MKMQFRGRTTIVNNILPRRLYTSPHSRTILETLLKSKVLSHTKNNVEFQLRAPPDLDFFTTHWPIHVTAAGLPPFSVYVAITLCFILFISAFIFLFFVACVLPMPLCLEKNKHSGVAGALNTTFSYICDILWCCVAVFLAWWADHQETEGGCLDTGNKTSVDILQILVTIHPWNPQRGQETNAI